VSGRAVILITPTLSRTSEIFAFEIGTRLIRLDVRMANGSRGTPVITYYGNGVFTPTKLGFLINAIRREIAFKSSAATSRRKNVSKKSLKRRVYDVSRNRRVQHELGLYVTRAIFSPSDILHAPTGITNAVRTANTIGAVHWRDEQSRRYVTHERSRNERKSASVPIIGSSLLSIFVINHAR